MHNHQIIYSSEATTPLQSDDLEELLAHTGTRNGIQGISGALVYADGIFLQIIEGDRPKLQALMAGISKDLRHENVTILREGEIPIAKFSSWNMAYIGATPEETARWAGIGAACGKGGAGSDAGDNLRRTAQFTQDILVLLRQEQPGGASRQQEIKPEQNAI